MKLLFNGLELGLFFALLLSFVIVYRIIKRYRLLLAELEKANEVSLDLFDKMDEAMERERQLGEKIQAIENLAKEIAHDFNNQLTGISGFASMLKEIHADEPKLKMMAEEILASSRRATELSSQLRTFSRKKKQPKAEASPTKTVKETGSEKERLIIVVDDEEMICLVGQKILEKSNYEVQTFANGKDAVIWFEKHKDKVSMAILDLEMPSMSGSDVFHALRKIQPELRVLIASGHSLEGNAQTLLDDGAKGYIQKPFNLEGLTEHVQKILQEEF